MTDNRGRSKFVHAKSVLNETKEYAPKLIKKLQEGFCEAVDDHLDWLRTQGGPHLLLSEKPKGEQFDTEMMLWIQKALRDVLAGHKSPFLEPTTAEGIGSLGESYLKKKLIEDAVFYRHCVEKGLIKDPEPVKTIALSYGVSTSAVQKWGEDPEFEHVKRHDPKEPPDPYGIRSLLEIHGEIYRKKFSPKKDDE